MLEYEKLHKYYEKRGTSSVPYDHELFDWCELQRSDKKISKYKKDLLNGVDFVWDTNLHPSHLYCISRIYNTYKKKGKFEISKPNEISNFIRLCIYRKEKGSLPQNIKHALEIRGIELNSSN